MPSFPDLLPRQRLKPETLNNLQVKAVEPGAVVVKQGKSPEDRQVAYGTCIWTTGNRMHPLADDLAQKLPHGQSLLYCPQSTVVFNILQSPGSSTFEEHMLLVDPACHTIDDVKWAPQVNKNTGEL